MATAPGSTKYSTLSISPPLLFSRAHITVRDLGDDRSVATDLVSGKAVDGESLDPAKPAILSSLCLLDSSTSEIASIMSVNV